MITTALKKKKKFVPAQSTNILSSIRNEEKFKPDNLLAVWMMKSILTRINNASRDGDDL